MSKPVKLPQIVKINWIKDLSISVDFNNGESRIIDFRAILKKLSLTPESPIAMLYATDEFAKVKISNNTLSWSNVEQRIPFRNHSTIRVPFEIGADVLLKCSKKEISEQDLTIGRLLQKARMANGLTQQDLAVMSGTTRSYISRIENDKSDIEIGTLRRIVESGLGKKLLITIK
ncbi:MAG: helix-turn-helix domain-containing protein [Candidatus Marinimicrobia bacterium]|nr:helix-turn-helix domain-containing protein [Candidatus Neomarinimicrobiota bacterium]